MRYVILMIIASIPMLITTGACQARTFNGYSITILLDEKVLALSDNEGTEKGRWPVGVPKDKPKNQIEGTINEVILNPYWFPTEDAKKDAIKRGGKGFPERVEPGDILNGMGVAKFMIIFKTKKVSPFIRVHGTNDEESVGRAGSGGCIRMKNSDILELVSLITLRPVAQLRALPPHTSIMVDTIRYIQKDR